MDVYIYTLYGARFQPTVVTHKAKKGPISWPHTGSKGKTLAPTGLCNWARGHLTIINMLRRIGGKLGVEGKKKYNEIDGQICLI